MINHDDNVNPPRSTRGAARGRCEWNPMSAASVRGERRSPCVALATLLAGGWRLQGLQLVRL